MTATKTRASKPSTSTPLLRKSLGAAFVRWCPKFVVHGEGDLYGKPFVLRPDQKLIAYQWFELEEGSSNRWHFERAYLEGPKGDGKTMLLAAMACFEVWGPHAPDYPNVPVAAAGQDQAMRDGIFGRIKQIVEHPNCPLRQFAKVGYDIIERTDRPGRIMSIPANGTTTDGGLPTLFLADEVQDWFHSAADAHERNENSATKRESPQGRSFSASTPGEYSGDGSVGWRLHNYGRQIETGTIDDPRFLYIRHAADDTWDLSDLVQREAALRQANVGASDKKIERLLRRYDEIPEHRWRRFHLAQWVESDGARWMDMARWHERAEPDRIVEPGTEIVAFFDGSISDDATAIVAMTLDGFHWPVQVWEKPENLSSWNVPRHEVDAAVDKMFAMFKVRAFGCDPSAGWKPNVDEWANRHGATVVLEVPPTDQRMAPAADQYLADIVNGEISHSGDPILVDHVRNCIGKPTRYGEAVRKEHYDSPRKIDAAVCAIGANDLRRRQKSAKPPKSKTFRSF